MAWWLTQASSVFSECQAVASEYCMYASNMLVQFFVGQHRTVHAGEGSCLSSLRLKSHLVTVFFPLPSMSH